MDRSNWPLAITIVSPSARSATVDVSCRIAAAVSAVGKVRGSSSENVSTRSSVRMSSPWTSKSRASMSNSDCRGLIGCSVAAGAKSATFALEPCSISTAALLHAQRLRCTADQSRQSSHRQVRARKLLDDPPTIENQRPVADASDLVEIAGDQQDRCSAGQLVIHHLVDLG